MPRREPVAPLVGARARVVDREDPRDGLLLEPLARVALVGAGLPGEVGRGRLPGLGQRLVQAEAIAQVDGEELEGAERSARKSLGQSVSLGDLRRDGRRRS